MKSATTNAIVIGALGAVATYLLLGPAASLAVVVWAAFIAWAAYIHAGGGIAALKNNIPAHIWGALCAAVGLYLASKVSIGDASLTTAIWVGVTLAVMVGGTQLAILGPVPPAFYGFAATLGFASLGGQTGDMLSGGLGTNPFLTISVSMIVGALLGYVAGKISGALSG
jgi:Protein of unknown function (DUF1097)